jgi:haloalkane dehalogenase
MPTSTFSSTTPDRSGRRSGRLGEVDSLRTPDERFRDLPGWPFPPHYVEVPAGDGDVLRMAYIDEGPADGPAVLCLHGEPSWSYLYRKMVSVFTEAGLRTVAIDLVGFGRSDKPVRREDYTYQRHVDWTRAALATVNLRAVTLVCQDWGGLIGLRLVAEQPDRFARVVAANTFLPTGDRDPGEEFRAWQRYSQETPSFDPGGIVKGGCVNDPPADVIGAYNAPFPDARYLAGARQFPTLVPTRPDDPSSEANRRAWAALRHFTAPFLCAFSDADPITRGADQVLAAKIPGARGQAHAILHGAGHFLQEDAGPELARIVVDFIEAT